MKRTYLPFLISGLVGTLLALLIYFGNTPISLQEPLYATMTGVFGFSVTLKYFVERRDHRKELQTRI